MSQVAFTGERLHAGSSLFGVDLARHRAPYLYALDYANSGANSEANSGANSSSDSRTSPGAALSVGFGPRKREETPRVLDLGCGSGYGTAELADALPRVVGLDRITHDAKNSRDNIDWLRADLRANPLAPGSFNLIVSFQVIEHLDDPQVYLESIARLLAPGGTAIITTPNILTSDKINPYHVHEYESEELRACLAPYFDEVVMQGVGLSKAVRPYFDARLERIAKIMRIDPLGIRNLLPKAWVAWLFAKGALWVRRSIRNSDDGLPNAYVGDFPIAPANPADIDLLAVCRKNLRRTHTKAAEGVAP
ncbi:MAG: class I SAM-dependent methyltransferase [Myxococcales bacterium]|nr:class I SAM-dependent methyltransferase [Myxococcales bacterium]